MPVFVIIPMKTLLESKTRLSIVLEPQERKTLTLTMLEDVLKAVQSSKACQTVVVTSDLTVQELTDNFGVTYLPEKKQGLNQAVKQATHWCIRNDAEAVLVLPADIPLLTPEDVNQIIQQGSEKISIVLAPSQSGGTNALLQKPPNLMPTYFGSDSFRRHFAEASHKGIPAKVYRSQRVAMDIDSLRDLENLLKIKRQTASHRFLKQIGLNMRLALAFKHL
jgi:2-phospho-L-lactate guanylyltransferase